MINTPLSKSQIENATENFEQVLSEIIRIRIAISILLSLSAFYLYFKFVRLFTHHFRHDARSAEDLRRRGGVMLAVGQAQEMKVKHERLKVDEFAGVAAVFVG